MHISIHIDGYLSKQTHNKLVYCRRHTNQFLLINFKHSVAMRYIIYVSNFALVRMCISRPANVITIITYNNRKFEIGLN